MCDPFCCFFLSIILKGCYPIGQDVIGAEELLSNLDQNKKQKKPTCCYDVSLVSVFHCSGCMTRLSSVAALITSIKHILHCIVYVQQPWHDTGKTGNESIFSVFSDFQEDVCNGLCSARKISCTLHKVPYVRCRLTRFFWLCLKSRQILSLPNFDFANRIRT